MPDLIRSDLTARRKTFGGAGGGGRQGDEERVEHPEQGESGVMLLLVMGAEVSVPVGGGSLVVTHPHEGLTLHSPKSDYTQATIFKERMSRSK